MKYKISVENLKPYGQRDMAYHGFGLAHGSTVGAASISNSSARAKGALGNSFFDTALLVCNKKKNHQDINKNYPVNNSTSQTTIILHYHLLFFNQNQSNVCESVNR